MASKKLLRPRHEPEYDEPVWFGLSRSGWSTWAILAVIVFLFFILGVGGLLGRFEFGFLFVVMLLALIVICYVASVLDVKVLIDSKGIHARCGVFGRPRRTIHWSDVKSVEVVDVNPAKLRGFGFRWIPIQDGTAVVMRSGQALEIQQKSGKRFIVTLDAARDAAAFAQQFVGVGPVQAKA